MPTFLVLSRHAPENCPMVHEKTRKVYLDWLSSMDKISKKYKVKMLWGGSVETEHLSVFIMEAPNLEAFQKASMEPEVMALMATETTEVKLVFPTMEEGMKILKGK